jgi:hypothetical protein
MYKMLCNVFYFIKKHKVKELFLFELFLFQNCQVSLLHLIFKNLVHTSKKTTLHCKDQLVNAV